jgi:Protein of unknown function (DUF2865)
MTLGSRKVCERVLPERCWPMRKASSLFYSWLVLTTVIVSFAARATADDFQAKLASEGFWKTKVIVARPRSYASQAYCVRLCDGFYWPVSSRKGSRHAVKQCASSCRAPVRLFRVSVNGRAEDMRDAKGRKYSALPNAFKYRTVYSRACTCRSPPWSETELKRHANYSAGSRRTTRTDRDKRQKRRPIKSASGRLLQFGTWSVLTER